MRNHANTTSRRAVTWRITILLAVTVFIFASSPQFLNAAEKNARTGYTVKRLERSPTIDGHIAEDPAWEDVPSREDFITLDGESPLLKTRLRMGWRPEGIYVAVWCEESQMDSLKGQPDDTSQLWGDDSVEIHLDGPDTPGYQQFMINAFGAVQRRMHPVNRIVSPDCDVAAERDDNGWSVELHVSFPGLRNVPGADGAWHGNVARNRHAGERFRSSWARVEGGMHDQENFNKLSFAGELLPEEKAQIQRKIVPVYVEEIDERIQSLKDWDGSAHYYEDSVQPLIEEWKELKSRAGNVDEMAPPQVDAFLETIRGFKTTAENTKELALLKGPYLQNLRADRVTVMWQTTRPAPAELTWWGQGEKKNKTLEKEGRFREVTIDGLRPDRRYFYRIECGREGNISGSGAFTTLTPPEGDRAFSFVVFGDSRSQPDRFSRVIRGIKREQGLSFALHTGDLVGDGKKAEQWQSEYFDPAAPLLKDLSVWPVLGNHEKDSDLYFQYFSLPGNERWYAVDIAQMHFVFLDVHFSEFSPGSEQYEWLKNDLQDSADRPTVVTFHAPPFSSGTHGGAEPVQKHVVPLLEEYDVKLVFCGHEHMYERSRKEGVTYITQGTGGAPLRDRAGENPYSQKVACHVHGYTVVHVSSGENGREARVVTRSAEGKLLDTVTIDLD